MSLSILRRAGLTACAFVVITSMACQADSKSPMTGSAAPAVTKTQASSAKAANAEAEWKLVRDRVAQANKASAAALDKRLKEIGDYLAERINAGARPFAEAVLKNGTWDFLEAHILGDGDKDLHKKNAALFAANLFTNEQLQKVISNAAEAYLTDLKTIENEAVLDIYKLLGRELDVAELNRDQQQPDSDKSLREVIDRLSQTVLKRIDAELYVAGGTEVSAFFVPTRFAEIIVKRVLIAVSTRLGISTAILSSGAASGVVTLGVGVLVSFVLDSLVDFVRREFFDHNPERDLSDDVAKQIRTLGMLIVDGDEKTKGLRHQLGRIHTLRALARATTLHKLIHGSPEKPAEPKSEDAKTPSLLDMEVWIQPPVETGLRPRVEYRRKK